MHIGRRTLSDYENGETLCPPDVIDAMATLYSDPKLRIMYCTEVCPLGAIHDRLEEYDLSTVVLGMMNEYRKLGELIHILPEIFADGKLDAEELPKYKPLEEAIRSFKKKIATFQMKVASQIVVS